MIGRIILLLFALLSSTYPLHAQKKKKQEVVFTIDKKAVSVDEFVYLYNKNHQHKPEEFTEAKIDDYLTLYINFKLKVAEAQSRGLDTTQAFKKEFNSYKDELRKPYLPDTRLVDSLVKITYERMKEEVNASHILVSIKSDSPADTLEAFNKAQALRNRTLAGEDFNTLAEQNSDDPSSKVNKGKLGYFTALQMVFPFENAAYKTPPASISQPVRTRFGYHLIKVHERRPSRGEVEVAHIVIRTGEAKDNAQSKNTIFDVYDQLQHGGNWDELCRQYSEDPSSKETGGKLRPFGIGVMATVPAFEQAAFALNEPGDISDPFETQYGWHIVKLIRRIELAPFTEVAPNIKNRVARDERLQISRQALYKKLRKDQGFIEFADAKKKLLALADSSVNKGKWHPANPPKDILFTIGARPRTIPDAIKFVQSRQRPTRMQASTYIEQQYDAFVESEILKELENDIMAKNPEFGFLLKEYYEGILLFDIMEKEVWTKASQDSVGQLRHFEANSAKYHAGERIKADVYSSTTREHIEKLRSILTTDPDKVNELVASLKIKKESGAFEKDERQVFKKIEWKPGTYISENNNLHYLVLIHEILPPGPKTFSEARPEVISDYQSEIEKSWVQSLRKKYPVKIDKAGKQAAIKQLTNASSSKTK